MTLSVGKRAVVLAVAATLSCSAPAPFASPSTPAAPFGVCATAAPAQPVDGALIAAVRAVVSPLAVGEHSPAYGGVAIGATASDVLSRAAEVKPGAYPFGEAFPTRFVTAHFSKESTASEIDVLDGAVLAVRGRAAVPDNDRDRDPVDACAVVVAEERPRFGSPAEVTSLHVHAARDGCTVEYVFDDARVRFDVRDGEVILEVRGYDATKMNTLRLEAEALLEKRKRAETCAMCRELRPGQSVEHWYRVVSVDLRACTMSIKQVSFGMSPPDPNRKLASLTDVPCTTYDGY